MKHAKRIIPVVLIAVMALVLLIGSTAFAKTIDVGSNERIISLTNDIEYTNNKDGTIILTLPELSTKTRSMLLLEQVMAWCEWKDGHRDVEPATPEYTNHTLHYGYELSPYSYGNDEDIMVGEHFTCYDSAEEYYYYAYWGDMTPFEGSKTTITIGDNLFTYVGVCAHPANEACTQPEGESFLAVGWFKNPIKITYDLNGGTSGGSTANKTEYLEAGDALATTFAKPKKGTQVLAGWYDEAEGGSEVTTFSGDTGVTVYAHYVDPTPFDISYSAPDGHASFSAVGDELLTLQAVEDDEIRFTIEADEGYEIASVEAKTQSGVTVDVFLNDGVYSFTMPGESVTVIVKAATPGPKPVPKTGDSAALTPWIVLMAAAGAACILLCRKRRV